MAHPAEDATLRPAAGGVPRELVVKRPTLVDKSKFTFLQKLKDTQAAPSRYAEMQIL